MYLLLHVTLDTLLIFFLRIKQLSERRKGMRSSQPSDRLKGKIHSNIFWLGIATFLGDISNGLINVVLPIFLQNVLGLNKTFIGAVEGIADFTAGILRIFFGWFSDRLGKRKIFVWVGYLLASLSRPLLGFASSGPSVLVLRFTDRFGAGIRMAPGDALIADQAGAKQRGRSFGFNRAMDSLGYVAGPLLAYVLLRFVPQGYRLVLWVTAIPAFLTMIVVTLFVHEHSRPGSTTLSPLILRGLDPQFKHFIIIVVLFTLGNSSDAFLILRAQSLGITPAIIPLWWALYNVVSTFIAMPSGIISDRIGRFPLIIIGYLCFAAVYFGFAVASHSGILWLLILIYGVYKGMADGAQRTLAADLIPPERRGSAFGVYYTLLSLAALPSSVLAGLLWDTFGSPAPFYFGAALALISTVLMANLMRKFRVKPI